MKDVWGWVIPGLIGWYLGDIVKLVQGEPTAFGRTTIMLAVVAVTVLGVWKFIELVR